MYATREENYIHGTSALKITQPRHARNSVAVIEVDFGLANRTPRVRRPRAGLNSCEAVPRCIRRGCLYNGLSVESLRGQRIGKMTRGQSALAVVIFAAFALACVLIGI